MGECWSARAFSPQVGSFMAAVPLYSTWSFRACRARLLLPLRHIPLSSLQLQRPALLASTASFQQLLNRNFLDTSHLALRIRFYCALNVSSGSPNLNRNLSQEELELEEEISKLERQHRDAVAKLASTRKSIVDLEENANLASYESTSGASRMKQSSKDQVPEQNLSQKARLPEALKRTEGAKWKSSTPEVRQVVSVDEEDDGGMASMLENDFSSDEDMESDSESDVDVPKPKSCESSGTHPWDEWNAFLDVLHRKNYFKDVAKTTLEGEGRSRFQDASYTKHAIVEFGRERDDIIRFLTKKHIRTVVNIGCPSTDRKVVNAAKRLRMYCVIPEDEVCQQCKLKTFCTRAFAEPAPKIDAGTIDVVRVLYSFALNASPDAESQMTYPIGVVKSACHLLNEIVQLSAYPRDPGLPKARSLSSANKLLVVKKATDSQDPDRRPGDWTCPDCNFLNFSKNRECRECGTFRENAEQHLEPGDWECPECTFINFRRNKECRECLTQRPKSEHASSENMEFGDWKCAECQFVNFRKNNECRRCSAKRPKSTRLADVEELEPGDWRCPKCKFRNFRRNKECRECSTSRPADTDWTSSEPRNDDRWGLKKPLTKSDGGWGSSKSLSASNTGNAGNRSKYQEWKPDLKKQMDDDLEEDADIVISKDHGSFSEGNSSMEGSDNELNFSDLEDEIPQRTSMKKAMTKENSVSQIFDDDEDASDDDMGDSEDDSEDSQTISRSGRLGKGREQSFQKWDGMSEDEGDLSDEKEGYGGQNKRKSRSRGREKFMSNGKNRFSDGAMHRGGVKEENSLEDRRSSRNSSFSSDDETDRSNRRGSMRSLRTSSFSSDKENDRYNKRGSMRSLRTSSLSSSDDRFSKRGSVRASRASCSSSDDDRSTRKGNIRAPVRGNKQGGAGKRVEEDTYSKTSSGGRVRAKVRGRQ